MPSPVSAAPRSSPTCLVKWHASGLVGRDSTCGCTGRRFSRTCSPRPTWAHASVAVLGRPQRRTDARWRVGRIEPRKHEKLKRAFDTRPPIHHRFYRSTLGFRKCLSRRGQWVSRLAVVTGAMALASVGESLDVRDSRGKWLDASAQLPPAEHRHCAHAFVQRSSQWMQPARA
jgi:hypothetical protein